MRRIAWLVAMCSGGIGTGPASAGIYVAERPQLPPLPEYSRVRLYLSELRGIAQPPVEGATEDANSLRALFLARVAELAPRETDGSLGLLERIDLGACYLRLRRFSDAVRVLSAADPKHFMVAANLATAFHELGELDRAISYQEQALANWPAVWAGWDLQRWAWYRRCELLYKRILELRRAELRTSGGRPAPVRSFDALFPGFPPVGSDGEFAAGPLPRLWETLPQDAVRSTLQLMIWLPFDDRLAWLYAELANVDGEVDLAYSLLDELVFARQWTNVPQLRQHLLILREAKELRSQLTPDHVQEFFWRFAPRGLPGVPGLGSAAGETAWPAADLLARQARDPASLISRAAVGGTNNKEGEAAATGGALPNFRVLLVGVVTGAVLTLLALAQWRQLKRRPSRPPAG